MIAPNKLKKLVLQSLVNFLSNNNETCQKKDIWKICSQNISVRIKNVCSKFFLFNNHEFYLGIHRIRRFCTSTTKN